MYTVNFKHLNFWPNPVTYYFQNPPTAMNKVLPIFTILTLFSPAIFSQQTQKPVIHGKNWMAITGKPLAATAGALIFQQGGNAVDASCAMLAATSTMWDVLSWGGETQAL